MRDFGASAEPAHVEDGIAAAIRHIVRAVDLHSRWLVEEHGLTGPQIATLRAAYRLERSSTGELARAVQLSHPTITGILDRLERKGLIVRRRGERDRRSVFVTVTPEGTHALGGVPSVLHARFRQELGKLPVWEQTMILATLQRVAGMMNVARVERYSRVTTEPRVREVPEQQEAQTAQRVD